MRFSGRRVYLTGATGFIGGVVARRLLAEGAEVTCLVRPQTDAARLEALGARVVRGNVTEPATLDVSGHDAVVHAAAWVGFGIPARHVALFRRTNVEGTRNVVHAAERAGVAKLVHVSSVAALGESKQLPLNEDAARARSSYASEYERTKTEAHLAVAASSVPSALPMPGLVLGAEGPFDWLVRGLARGTVRALPSGDAVKGWVHVEDTADAVLACLERGRGPYVLVDENMRLADLFATAMERAGLTPPRLRVPVGALLAGAAVVEGAYALRRRTPPISRELIGKMRVPMSYDSAKAKDELGWKPRLVERLADDLRRAAA